MTFTANRVIVNDPKKSWYEKELRFTNTVKPRCSFLTFTAIRNKFRFQNFLKIPDVHNTIHRFLTVHAAVTPTSVLPAPEHEKTYTYVGHRDLIQLNDHFIYIYTRMVKEYSPQGSTMTPDLALPFPNIFLKLFSCNIECI